MRSAPVPPPVPPAPAVQRELLARAAFLLSSAADFRDTLRNTIAACLPTLGDFGFFDARHGDQVIRTVAAHDAPDIEAMLAPTEWVPLLRDDGMNLCALTTGQPAFHPDIADGWYRKVAADEGQLAAFRQLGFRSMISVPMMYRGELVGALTLFMARSGRHHSRDDLEFAAEIAMLASPCVANAGLAEQHRRAEEALRRSEERLRLTTEAGRVGIWDWDILNDTVEWSDRVYELHEFPRDQKPGGLASFRDHVHPQDLARVEEAVASALAGGKPYATEYRILLPGGRIRWLSTQSHIVRDDSGKPVRMVGGCTDATERMELLDAERKAGRRLEILARAGDLLSRSLDPDETLRTIGHAIVPEVADWCRIDLIDEAGVLQRKLAHHQDPERSRRALELSRQLQASSATQGTMPWVLRTGRSHYGHFDEPDPAADPALSSFTGEFGMHAHFIIPLVARGRTIGVMGVLQAESRRDLSAEDRALVTELGYRAAQALDNARLYSSAEAANRAKDEFLAMLGHELRNPLAPIATALELMARRDPGAHVDERRIVGRQVAHLQRLIDDLLDVSRITRGKIQMLREPVDMKAVVAQAIELTRPVFEPRVQPLSVDVAPEATVVVGDAVRLVQVVCNLLTNAAKFTPRDGRVSLAVRREGGNVEIAVQDTGAGIDPQLLPHVFDLFVQGRQSIDRQSGGLGLGLAIVRTLVDMHGGGVQAHSDGPGRGARFTVRLPATARVPLPASAPEPAPARTGDAARILIVDDNVDAALTLSELLGAMGYEAQCVHHAREAQQLAGSFRPQVALLDIGLPDIDGYALAGMLRNDSRHAALKLVALTGYGRENDRIKTRSAGFDEHLVKPAAIGEVVGVVERLLSSPASP